MAEIPRERQRFVGPGMTRVGEDADGPALARALQEAQESLELAWRRIRELEARPAAVPAQAVQPYDDAWIRRALDRLQRLLRRQPSAVAGGTAPDPSDADPEDVGPAPDSGTSADYARADHVHEGIVWSGDVESLPAIPAAGVQIVRWVSAGAGTGDDQLWIAHEDDTEWVGMQATTNLSGTP